MENNYKIEGRNPVIEALKSDKNIDKIYVAKGDMQGSVIKIKAIAKENKIPVMEVDRRKLDEMSETKSHQGVIALAPPVEYVTVDDIVNIAREKNEPLFVVILDFFP